MQSNNFSAPSYWLTDPRNRALCPSQGGPPGSLQRLSSGTSSYAACLPSWNDIQRRVKLQQRVQASLSPTGVHATTPQYHPPLYVRSRVNFGLLPTRPYLAGPHNDSLLAANLLIVAAASNRRAAAATTTARRSSLSCSNSSRRMQALPLARSSFRPTVSRDWLNGLAIQTLDSHLSNTNQVKTLENTSKLHAVTSTGQGRAETVLLHISTPSSLVCLVCQASAASSDTQKTCLPAAIAPRIAKLTHDLLPSTPKHPQKKSTTTKYPSSATIGIASLLAKDGEQNDIRDEDIIKRIATLEALGLSTLKRRIDKSPYIDASVFQDPHPILVAAGRRSYARISDSFPEKLYRIIEEAEKDGNQDIVSFFPHGRGFGIHKPERFVKEIMPRFFKNTPRLTSFQRQLGLYGFGRISNGPDAGGYYHELFLRKRPALSMFIVRVGVPHQPGIAPRKRDVKRRDSVIDPDLYGMPEICPTDGAQKMTSWNRVV